MKFVCTGTLILREVDDLVADAADDRRHENFVVVLLLFFRLVDEFFRFIDSLHRRQ
jgi:hypothetical protein